MSSHIKPLSFLRFMISLGLICTTALGLYTPDAQAQDATPELSAKTPQTKTSTPSSTAVKPTKLPKITAPRVRGLSWSIKTGRIPSSGGIIHGSMGFSGLPRLAYHHTLLPNLSVGGLASFDYGHNHPSGQFEGGLLLGVPVRYRKPIGELDLGIGGIVGARFPGQKERDMAILVEAEVNIGIPVHHRFLVGGGITTPLWIGLGNKGMVFDIPLLIGPFVEFHVTPPLALTFEAKAGPYLTSATGQQTSFGMRTSMGIAYRL